MVVINFSEAIHQTKFDDIFDVALKHFDVYSEERDIFEEFYVELKKTKTNEIKENQIMLTKTMDYLEAKAKTADDRVQDFSFEPLDTILTYHLSEETVAEYGLDLIIATVLNKITFFGSDEERLLLAEELNLTYV